MFLYQLYQTFTFMMMKPYIFNLFIFICAAVSFNSCKDKTQSEAGVAENSSVVSSPGNKVDTTVVLKVGNEHFSAFELEKNFRIFKQKFFQNNHREPTEADRKIWVNEFVARAYVLADAREKGYYNRPDIQKIVETTAVFMLAQPRGILEQKLRAGLPSTAQSENEKIAAVGQYHIKISKAASVTPDKSAVALLWTTIYKNEKLHEVKKEAVANILNKKLATYRAPDGKAGNITVNRFMTYYNSLPLKRYLEDTTSVSMYLKQIAANEYIEQDAQKMGLLNDPEFRLNKKNYTDNTVYQKYMEDHLGTNRGVTETDITNVYATVKQYMTRPTKIVYSIYTFSNAPNGYKALGLLRMHPGDTTVNLNSLSQKRHIKFDKTSSQLPDTLKKMIYRGSPGQPLPPVETNGYFTVLMIESATGSEPFTANEIRPYLMARAKERRELAYSSKKANEMSKNLKAENNINMLTDKRLTTAL